MMMMMMMILQGKFPSFSFFWAVLHSQQSLAVGSFYTRWGLNALLILCHRTAHRVQVCSVPVKLSSVVALFLSLPSSLPHSELLNAFLDLYWLFLLSLCFRCTLFCCVCCLPLNKTCFLSLLLFCPLLIRNIFLSLFPHLLIHGVSGFFLFFPVFCLIPVASEASTCTGLISIRPRR